MILSKSSHNAFQSSIILTRNSPIQVGVKGLGYATAITVGATVVNAMLSILKGHNREILLSCCVLMSEYPFCWPRLVKFGNRQ